MIPGDAAPSTFGFCAERTWVPKISQKSLAPNFPERFHDFPTQRYSEDSLMSGFSGGLDRVRGIASDRRDTKWISCLIFCEQPGRARFPSPVQVQCRVYPRHKRFKIFQSVHTTTEECRRLSSLCNHFPY